jgi:predicted KAP-like P-loop ATPase
MEVTMRRLEMKIATWLARRAAKQVAFEARTKPLGSGIGAEAPIRTAADDRLRRTDFAGRLANVLSELSLDEGRVFAIRGGWGFGKSSLKNLITERLDEMNGGPDWLDFNPWRWGDADAIAKALFGQLANRLGGEHSKKALARAEALRRYGAMLTGATGHRKKAESSTHWISLALTNVSLIAIASAVGFQLPTVGKVAGVLAVLAVGSSILGRALTHWGRDRSNEPLENLRDALEERLKELDRPVVVFVDDIDRLEPEQIRMILRQVKANANLPNIVFVLLFQPSIVERALDPVADGDGRAFLEKIVQASFDLPAVPMSIVHDTFARDLQAVAGAYATEANGFEQTRWGNVFIGAMQPRLRNIRDAKRLISSIAVHLPLHATGDTFEVNLIDFFGVETIRVFEPDLYDALFRERDLVLQSRRFRGDKREEQDRRAVERLMDTVPEESRDLARDALKELFPTLEWAFGGTSYGNDWHQGWVAEKRICTSRFFPRYFELQTAMGELSESGFVHFLEETGDADRLALAIADIEANDLLISLISRMRESIDRLPRRTPRS